MMKTRNRYIVLLMLLFTALTAVAQNRIYGDWGSSYKNNKSKTNQAGLYTDQYDGVHHLVGMQVEGAYASFLQQSELMQFKPGGYSLGLTFQYAYLNGPFFLQTGIGLRWQDVQNNVKDQLYTIEAVDATGTPCQMDYRFHDRTDRMRELYAQLPFYLGGYFRGFYLMGGVKASMPLTGDTRVNMITTTTARYTGYIGPIEEMDNHGIRRDVPLTPDQQRGEELQLRIDVLGVFECGYEMAFSNKGRPGYHRSNMRDQRLRLGAFAELGILNTAPKTKLALYTVPDTSPYDFQTFRFNHVISTGQVGSLHSLYAGIRLTYFFFGVQSKEKCLLCGARGSVTPW